MSISERRLGRYQLQELLAQGGMGEVWRALDTQLQRTVAIKILLPERQNDQDFVNRFKREAQLVASLHHPNIVQIHNFHVAYPPETDKMTAYMVMDYVKGQTLADYIRSTSRKGLFPDATDILYIFSRVALALDYAHKREMIHRDIKPANILLDQRSKHSRPMGEPILTDFGIARQQGVSTGTVVGAVVGTPLYMAPEQALGKYDDKRSDLYSFGIVLYEIMTGIVPFRGDTAMSIVIQHIQAFPTPPALINPNVPQALSDVILKSIAKEPEARFASASAMMLATADALQVPIPENLLQHHQISFPGFSLSGTSSASPLSLSPAVMNTPQNVLPSPVRHALPAAHGEDEVVEIPAALTLPSSLASRFSTPTMSPPSQQPSQILPVPSMRSAEAMVPPVSRTRPPFSKKMRLVSTLVIFMVLVGSLFSVFLLSHQPSIIAVTDSPVGKITFEHKNSTTMYDAIQLDLHNIPDPPPGMRYYGWITSLSVESEGPHWELLARQGHIRTASLVYAGATNLLLPDSFFLITKEAMGGAAPVVPSFQPGVHLYYAKINATTSPIFMVKQCPANSDFYPCH